MSEKQVVFDVDGNPKELRYYEHDRLTARLGVILDGDKNFIGLRELDVAEVSPPSWLERLGLKKAVQPKRIDILTVDFIGLINWINTIKTIKTIENVDLLKEITTIKNVESVDLIDSITNIDNIANIANIAKITDISAVACVHSRNIVKNGYFETGDLRGWSSYAISGASVVVEAEAVNGTIRGKYYVKMTSTVAWAYIWQFIDPFKTINTRGSILAKTDASAGTLAVSVLYSDGVINVTNITPTTTWTQYPLDPFVTDKIAVAIQINNTKDNSVVYVDNVVLIPDDSVAQNVRTNLKVQSEREDLLCKCFDLTVGTTSLLGAVAGQYHKVYGWDYESDTAGANEFSATINATANTKFGRRVTAGVHAMTLVHPIVCDVNSALSFVSAGNTKLSLRYKTEA